MNPRRMHPWTRVNLFLALLLGLLVVLDFWPSSMEASDPLTRLAPGQIDALRVERGKRLHLGLRRTDDGWQLQHPEQAAARTERVAQLLTLLGAPRRYSFPAGNDLARYGLAEPAATLHVQGTSFGAVSLAFGDREPGQDGRYVLVGGDIVVVDNLFFNLLSLPPRHFIGD